MAMTTRANGGVLMHGAVGLEAAAAKRDDAIAHLWTWGITDVHALGYALHLGRSATYRLVSRGIDRGWWRLMRETGMPTSIIHLTAATAADYRRVMLGHRLADLPARTRPAAISGWKMSHDMVTQHASLRLIRERDPDWITGERVAQELRESCEKWLYIDEGNRWYHLTRKHRIETSFALPERIIRHLGLKLAIDADVASVEPDALVLLSARDGSEQDLIAIEAQESNQGLTRNRHRLNSYYAALIRDQLEKVVIASSSNNILKQTTDMIASIRNGEFMKMKYDKLTKEWVGARDENKMPQYLHSHISENINEMSLVDIGRHYYFGNRNLF